LEESCKKPPEAEIRRRGGGDAKSTGSSELTAESFPDIGSILAPYLNSGEILKRYGFAKQKRIPWEQKWQLIQDQVFPDYRDYIARASKHMSEPSTSKIKNHSGLVSGKIVKTVSLLNAQLTDPSVKWMDLKFGGSAKQFGEIKEVADWLWLCKEAAYDLFADPESNFYPSSFEFHTDWFTIGTACREIILRKDNGRIRFNTVSMQDICFDVSGYGTVNTVYRTLHLTIRQAFDLWGQNLHPQQLRLLQQSRGSPSESRKFEYVEVSMPNPVRNQLSIPTGDFVTCVIDKSNRHIVDIGVHKYSPYVPARFLTVPNEIYGRSYVWNTMPDILAVNRVSKRILQAIDFTVFPVNLVQDATSIVQSQITPGAFVQGIDYQGNVTIRPMQTGMDLRLAMEFCNMKSRELDDSLVSGDILPAEAPNMTATEVNERKIQASNRLRPLLVRLEHEDLNNTMRRTLSLMQQIGDIPPFPYEKANISPEQLPDPPANLRVHFSGQMSRMQKLQEIVNSDLLFQKALQLAQVDQSVLDRINLENLLTEDAKIYGVAPSVVNGDEQVQQIRDARAEAAQQQQQAQTEAAQLDNLIKLKEAGIGVGS
jgi:hypothetical protein